MRIAIQAETTAVRIIRELLSPWDISFTGLDEAEIVIAYERKPLEGKKGIVIPSVSSGFEKSVGDLRLSNSSKAAWQVSVAATTQTSLMVFPSLNYRYRQSSPSSGEAASAIAEFDRNFTLLTLDVVNEYKLICDRTLNARPATTYRLLTNSPVPYAVAPKRLRDLVMRKKHNERENLSGRLSLDALRFMLVNGIEKLLSRRPPKKTWNGRAHAYILTHDVDTLAGLQNARRMKRLEERYDMCSAWYIPTKHYKLDQGLVRELANYGEVGSHDTKHDGKLAYLSGQKLIERVAEARSALAKIAGQAIVGFRAPLLQHNVRIIRALANAGYAYDTSVPTWEPKHPYTMKPHGIGTIYPLLLESLVEIPVTLPQDHQLLTVLGLTPKESLVKWFDMIEVVKDLGGLCTLLVHPDYEMADMRTDVYEEILEKISVDHQGVVLLPSEIASQWTI